MKTLILAVAISFCAVLPAHAQTKGWLNVGASVTYIHPTDSDVKSTVSVGPIVRLTPKKGWGLAAGLNWVEADLKDPSGGDGEFARMRVRPLLAGVAYSVQSGNLLTSFSVVAGPSFNRVDFDDAFTPAGASIDIENSLAVRPGVGLTYTVAPRVAIIGFGGYMWNRPDTTYRSSTGVELRNRWRADAYGLSAGLVFSLF
jgi:hypothetical protein